MSINYSKAGLLPARMQGEGEGGREGDSPILSSELSANQLRDGRVWEMGNEWDVSIPHQPVTSTSLVIQSTPLPWRCCSGAYWRVPSWPLAACCQAGLRGSMAITGCFSWGFLQPPWPGCLWSPQRSPSLGSLSTFLRVWIPSETPCPAGVAVGSSNRLG